MLQGLAFVLPVHRRRKLFDIGWGGGAYPAKPTSILGGGVLPKVHIRMRAHAHVCTHMC